MPFLKFVTVAVGLALASTAQAATQFKATINAAQIVGGSTSTGTGTATATLVGGPGTWSFQYVAEFTGFDFGALMLPYVRDGVLLANNSPSAEATTVDTGDDVQNFHIHIGAAGFTGGVTYAVRQPDRENGSDPVVELLSDGRARISGSWDIVDGNTGTSGTNTSAGNLEAFWVPVMQAAQPNQAIGLYFDIHTNAYPGSAIRGQITAVPEPETYALMLAGLGVLGWAARRKQLRG
jgi:hypothetical protein